MLTWFKEVFIIPSVLAAGVLGTLAFYIFLAKLLGPWVMGGAMLIVALLCFRFVMSRLCDDESDAVLDKVLGTEATWKDVA